MYSLPNKTEEAALSSYLFPLVCFCTYDLECMSHLRRQYVYLFFCFLASVFFFYIISIVPSEVVGVLIFFQVHFVDRVSNRQWDRRLIHIHVHYMQNIHELSAFYGPSDSPIMHAHTHTHGDRESLFFFLP